MKQTPPYKNHARNLLVTACAAGALCAALGAPHQSAKAEDPGPPLLSADWRYTFIPPAGSTEHPLTGSLSRDGSAVITGGFGPRLGRLIRLSASGQLLWQKESPSLSFESAEISEAGDRITVSAGINESAQTDDGEVQASMLNGSGDLLWQTITPTAAAMSDSPLLTVTSWSESFNDRLYVFRGADGELLWNPVIEVDGDPGDVLVCSAGDRILVRGGGSIRMHTTSGQLLWSQPRAGVLAMDASASGNLAVILRKVSNPSGGKDSVLVEGFGADGILQGSTTLSTVDPSGLSLRVSASGARFIVLNSGFLPESPQPSLLTGYSPTCSEVWQRSCAYVEGGDLWRLGQDHFVLREASEQDPNWEAVLFHLVNASDGSLSRSARVPVGDASVVVGGSPQGAIYLLTLGMLEQGEQRVQRFTLPPP